jgi:hypothetical protein
MKRLTTALLLASCAMPSLADIAWVNNVTIQATLIEDGKYGGCMIKLNKSIIDAGISCPAANWLSLDCDGAYTSVAGAQRMYDTAQMAFVLEKKVFIRVDDSKKHNGYCVAIRMDMPK